MRWLVVGVFVLFLSVMIWKDGKPGPRGVSGKIDRRVPVEAKNLKVMGNGYYQFELDGAKYLMFNDGYYFSLTRM